MRAHVAFTPGEAANAQLGIVVDVLRATSTITQALASGYERVYCCREVGEARALRDTLGEGLLGGERNAVRIEGFDVGASPREFLGEPRAPSVIFSTTNGTRAILETASRADDVLLGSLLNLDAVATAARERGEDVTIVCAGFQGQFALTAPAGSCSFSEPSRPTRRRPRTRSPARGRTPTTASSPARTVRPGSKRTLRSVRR
jgi:phosphosulfolactate phosphohydrolase-like enzyme